jgi:hypothetical protein
MEVVKKTPYTSDAGPQKDLKGTSKNNSFSGNGSSYDLTEDVVGEVGITDNQVHPMDLALIQCKIDPEEEITAAPICLEFSGKNGSAIVGTYGNFSAVIGKAKSRKTFLISLVAASFITLRFLMGKIKATAHQPKNKILLFDTEQSRFHLQKVVRRIFSLAGNCNADQFEAYCLRTFDPKTRLAMMKRKLLSEPNTALAIIDGIRDVVFDINDAKEATEITTDLMKLSEELGIHIMVVIHQNKNDNNARGHLGTEIINKAESVLQVAKDSNNDQVSIVEAERCREKEFEPFAFRITEEGLPEIIGEWVGVGDDTGKPKKLTANQIPDTMHFEILKEAFSKLTNPKYSDVMERVTIGFQAMGTDLGNTRARQFMAYYNSKGWIKPEKVTGSRYPVYQFSRSV